MTDPKQSRGYRNRNPGNIDWNAANRWQGQIGIEKTGAPPRFAAFTSHEFGIRALASLLTTYQDRHGCDTVRKVISRWAPGNENNTEAYIHAVANAVGTGTNDPIDMHDYADLRPMVEAIITHECGGQPYDDATLDEGLRLAGVARPVVTVQAAAATSTGKAALTVGGMAAAAATAAPAVQALAGLPQWVGVAVVVAVCLVATAMVLTRRIDA